MSNKFFAYNWLFLTFIALILYHQSEFISIILSSGYISIDSYCLNELEFWQAFSILAFEHIVEIHMFSASKIYSMTIIRYFGLFLITCGDLFRIISILYCGDGFSHILNTNMDRVSKLVTSGPYRLFRHPSYVGWIVWVYGFVILLQTPISSLIFTFAIYRFFSERILIEERILINLYGEEYIEYMKKVPTGIPFIRSTHLNAH
ncbi:hypothetical protein HZS_1468 [Henneguya salminicola]|nr:hypothetical protein HZS_1468 [Henneguya salminicola]